MLNTPDQLSRRLQDMGHEPLSILTLPIPGHGDPAFAIEVPSGAALALWTDFRAVLDQTQRWPVLAVAWSHGADRWREAIQAEDFFSRQPFAWESNDPDRDVSPGAIAQRSLTAAIAPLIDQHNALYTEDLATTWSDSLDQTRQRLGQAPSIPDFPAFMAAQKLQGYLDFERWLLTWELDHGGAEAAAPDDCQYLEGFDPQDQPQALLLLPTQNSWEVLAFIHWFGAETTGSEVAIARVRHWHERYGAELVAHYGTMLQFAVQTCPPDMDAAWQLAVEQEALAPCTTALPGISLRDHARCLRQARCWLLHERP